MQYINKEKIEKIKLNKSNFYVAIDFDKTITSGTSSDSWDACGNILGEEFKKESQQLYNKYAPIELDYTISFDEKNNEMEQWYYAVMNLYYKYHLTKEKLKTSIKTANLIFRKGAKEFLYYMYKNNIPVVILSAGIGNVIEQFLENNNCYYNNICIISNFIKFDENGYMIKFDSSIIHTLNKTMEGHTTKFSKEIQNTTYRLLLGDFIEDKNMVPSYEWNRTISVGFLCKNIEQNLEVYKESFDIVLTQEDASFDTVISILGLN